MMVTTRRGTLSRWVTAVAATASGGDTIAPSTNATCQLIPGMNVCATQATAVVVATTRPMASSAIGRLLAAKSRHDVNHAAAYSSGGRNSSSTSSGLMWTRGRPGMNASARPPTTSRMG